MGSDAQGKGRPEATVTAKRAPLTPIEKIWVTGVVLLIAFLVISSQVCILVPYFLHSMPYELQDAVFELVKILGPFNLGALGIVWNYYQCVTLDPGAVPVGWKPPLSEINQYRQRKADAGGAFAVASSSGRFCKPCNGFKPPRTHHCRTCKRCVLRMDHHCPWVANCVGQRNYASFMRFLFWVDVTCSAHLVLLSLRTGDYWWTRIGGSWRPPTTTTMVFLVLNFVLCIPTLLLVGIFSLYHFWCLCTNTTTVEGWEKDKADRMINRGRIREVDYPFDLGFLRNLQSVFGTSPLRWCVPSVTQGDGVAFEVADGLEFWEQYEWPPRDHSRTSYGKQRPVSDGRSGSNNIRRAPLPGSTPTTLRHRGASRVPPWHPDYEQHNTSAQGSFDTPSDSPATLGDQWHSEEDGDRSDDEMNYTHSHVRRGSEGYEVRPKRYDMAVEQEEWIDHDAVFDDTEDDELWAYRQREEEEERVRQQIQAQWISELRQGRRASSSDVQHSSTLLLPSQVMQLRLHEQERQGEPLVESE